MLEMAMCMGAKRFSRRARKVQSKWQRGII